LKRKGGEGVITEFIEKLKFLSTNRAIQHIKNKIYIFALRFQSLSLKKKINILAIGIK
tara:strand:- start:700 stop:873 length:174 start_codon:yes stop_codon:yes gene_type:complete